METGIEDAGAGRDVRSAAPALTKGFAILDLVANEPGLTFAAIRRKLGLPNSSCHHLINTLCQLGALRPGQDRGYVLGLRLLELGSIAASQRQIEHVALPFLQRLVQDVQLTCHLGVLEGQAAVYLLKVEGRSDIRVNTWAGKRLSLHSSSLGKTLLAWLPEAELDALLAHLDWRRRGPNTITDPVAFRRHLAEVRQRGWALDDEEDVASIRCVASPVMDRNGRVVAAISAVGTVLDIDVGRIDGLVDRIRATAGAISRELG